MWRAGFLMKMWLMNPRLALEFCARLAAVAIAGAAPLSCGADGTGLVPDCSFGSCDGPDSSDETGGHVGDAAAAPADGGASDSSDIGSRRSPLCAVTGCFPGFTQACLSAPPVDAGADDVANLQLDPEEGGDGADLGDAEDTAAPSFPDANPGLGDDASTIGSGGPSDAAPPVLLPDGYTSAYDGGGADGAALAEAGVSDVGNPSQSCYVSPSPTGVVASCALAGSGIAGSACADSGDCSISLACVQVDGAGVCRPFSCGLPPSCPSGSFYQLAPLVVGGTPLPATVVPVCTPNSPSCSLLATPSGCTSGKVCAVVGNDGETSCVTPGPAKRNESCDESTPCGDGLVCAIMTDKTQNRCLQLCHVDQSAAECPGGTCQGGNNAIPTGFGICVGDDPDAG
jgi:hypothetical protein